jgi:hypothetical protein
MLPQRRAVHLLPSITCARFQASFQASASLLLAHSAQYHITCGPCRELAHMARQGTASIQQHHQLHENLMCSCLPC